MRESKAEHKTWISGRMLSLLATGAGALAASACSLPRVAFDGPEPDAVVSADSWSDGFDAAADSSMDPCVVPTPRAISPLSTASVYSQRPRLRWTLPPGADGARVEIFRDRACTMMVTSFDAVGSEGAPSSSLVRGTYFWRLTGRSGAQMGICPSAVWQFVVTGANAPRNVSWGTVPDFDGDGLGDVAVGADAQGATGNVYVFNGSATGPAQPPTTLTPVDATSSGFGTSLASAGDLDGDGFAELVVGAPFANGNAGRVLVYRGGIGGLVVGSETVIEAVDGAGGRFGVSVSAAGDIDGDGYGDLIVGARRAPSSSGAGAGRAYVFLGSATGVTTTAHWVLTGVDLGDDFGRAVASAGDFDGDGYGDIVVGAQFAPMNSVIGRAYVYRGGTSATPPSPMVVLDGGSLAGNFGYSVALAGDINADGYADVVVGAPYSGTGSPAPGAAYVFAGGPMPGSTPLFAYYGPVPDSRTGTSVAGVGDVNADGYDDVLIGAPAVPGSPSMLGAVYLIAGPISSTSVAAWSTGAPGGTQSQFGVAVGRVGDVDGDGVFDLAAGEPYAPVTSGATGGWVFGPGWLDVFAGSATTLLSYPSWTLVNPGNTSNGYGMAVARAGSPRVPAVPTRRPNHSLTCTFAQPE